MPVSPRVFGRVRPHFSVVIFAIASSGLVSSASAQKDPAEGCYRVDRVLSSSASGMPLMMEGDSAVSEQAYSRFELQNEGRVDRRGTANRNAWARASRWETIEGTLQVRLSTGLSGWELRLVPDPSGDGSYIGEARYLTDVVVASGTWEAPRLEVRVTREPCAEQ